MDINTGFFTQNGGCGFVLKPDYMTRGSERPKGMNMVLRVRFLYAISSDRKVLLQCTLSYRDFNL
jgi:hypothetical protein